MSKSQVKPHRCQWAQKTAIEQKYHDKEWGVPVTNDRKLFEFLCLEGAQAGLSWVTILNKRKAYRELFDGFDFNKVALYNKRKINQLLKNPGIVRNRLKVESVVTNAQALLEVRAEFRTFNRYIWQFVDYETRHNRWRSLKQIPANTAQSDAMSKDLKKRGFRFVGTTICYAFMQATGMVNDHETGCFRYHELIEP